jgi:hypothetical protein
LPVGGFSFLRFLFVSGDVPQGSREKSIPFPVALLGYRLPNRPNITLPFTSSATKTNSLLVASTPKITIKPLPLSKIEPMHTDSRIKSDAC